jgi:peroxiredoxin
MPSLRALRQQLAGKAFEVLAVNVREKPYKVRKFSRLLRMDFPVLLDNQGEAFDAWGATVLPTSYIVDPEGRLRYVVHGPLDWAADEVIETVRSLIEGQTPEAPVRATQSDVPRHPAALPERAAARPG